MERKARERANDAGGADAPAARSVAQISHVPCSTPHDVRIRHLGCIDYEPTWRAMQEFTAMRVTASKMGMETPDEIWCCEHPPVFTLGQAGKVEHLLQDIGIPLVKIDRGGQIAYHGPGQLVVYLLLDLHRRNLKVRALVTHIEQALIDLLAEHGITGERQPGAPGVYVSGAKIAALGLRIRNGCSYHGLSLNVDMDLSPYAAINPCGYAGMPVTQLSALCPDKEARDMRTAEQRLLTHLLENLA